MPAPAAPLPPNPSLLALLLVINSRTGPRLVFHYPPEPSASSTPADLNAHASWYAAGTTSTETEDGSEESRSTSAWSSDSDAEGAYAGEEGTDWGGSEMGVGEESGSEGGSVEGSRASRSSRHRVTSHAGGSTMDEEVEAGSEGSAGAGKARREERVEKGEKEGKEKKTVQTKEMPWETVLGFSAEGLGKMLSPPRGFHKRRFEMGVEGLVFLGAPMFVGEDGTWKKRKRRRRDNGGGDAGEEDSNRVGTAVQAANDHDVDADIDGGLRMAREKFDLQHVPIFEPGYGHDLLYGASSPAESEAKSVSTTGGDCDMNMFNVVFILNPPMLEYHLRVEEMYNNVVKKLAKTLKYEQAQSNYVWREAQAIMALKEKAKLNSE